MLLETRRSARTEEWKGKRVVILGLARQGAALVRFLLGLGADVTVSDLRSAEELRETVTSLKGLSPRYVLGEHPLTILDGADLVCVSAGVPIDAPIVAEAQRRQIPLSNDAQLRQCFPIGIWIEACIYCNLRRI